MLAFANPPNHEAIALSPTVGWLFFATALFVFLLFAVQADRWRRFWLQTEDPRSIGLFRIVFAFLAICNVNGLWEHFHFLFTDEGIFTADVARQVHAAKQFKGFGEGMIDSEPWGFFDLEAWFTFFSGHKYSLLYFWDSPRFFWAHLWAFELFAVLFMIGLWTRTTGIIAFLLMNSIFFRNHLFWEGTDVVYRVFFVYLILARSGHAYSVDNWLRCRRLRKQGLLSEPATLGGGAGIAPSKDYPLGLQAIYRRIPAWPRILMMLQLCTIMTTTGILKNGSVWSRGDAIYYAWNLDHFYRFYPQKISALFGTNLLRWMTWFTHFGEIAFSLVFVGIVLRWAMRQTPLATWQRWIVRVSWIGIVVSTAMMIYIIWPVHQTPKGLTGGEFVALWILAWAALWAIWILLGKSKPLCVRNWVFTREWACKWFLGRRIWLSMELAIMGGIFVLMNIGQFQTIMLAAVIPFLHGHEIASGMRWLRRKLHLKHSDKTIIPTENPCLPHLHQDSFFLPPWAIASTGLWIFAAIAIHALWKPDLSFTLIILVSVLFLIIVKLITVWTSDKRKVNLRPPCPAWAYDPFGRLLVGMVIVWHICAVAIWLLPEKDSIKTFREPARKFVTAYMNHSQTAQSWSMFAPNPPRRNVFLQVIVYDQEGTPWDLKTDLYAPEKVQIPFLWNDRMRKMNRRIADKGKLYRKWYARYHCRQWALDHQGETPQKVVLIKYTYPIPTPEYVREHGPYEPQTQMQKAHQQSIIYTEHCANAVMGQLSNELRERHGLSPLPATIKYKPWIKQRKKAWEQSKNQPSQASSMSKRPQTYL